MSTKKSKTPSKSAVYTESQEIAVDEVAVLRDTTVEPDVHDEPDIDAYAVYQPGPDEAVWTPVEPVAASDDAAAPALPRRRRRVQYARSQGP